MQAVTALGHLKASILYIMDISELCDHSIGNFYLQLTFLLVILIETQKSHNSLLIY